MGLVDFSMRSLGQAYGHTFLRRIVLRHPLRALRGLLSYRQTLSVQGVQERAILRGDEDAFMTQAASDGQRLLVATGFCQKPAYGAGDANGCPAGRFNHQCRYILRLELGLDRAEPRLPACADCAIGIVGHAALEAGASFAVLTSALDIAHDILLPALEQQRFARFLFAICAYSVEPMSLALLVCGLEGYIVSYDSGACANYAEWLRADRGDKPERTFLAAPKFDQLLQRLGRIAAARQAEALPSTTRYVREGNIFVPR